jgi:hypothetical protein
MLCGKIDTIALNFNSSERIGVASQNTQTAGAATAQSVYRRAMDWTDGVRFPARARSFSSLNSIQTGSGAHTPSYPMGIGGSFLGGKAAGA